MMLLGLKINDVEMSDQMSYINEEVRNIISKYELDKRYDNKGEQS